MGLNENAEWIQSLKEGDHVAWVNAGGSVTVAAVARVTATQVTVCGCKFRRTARYSHDVGRIVAHGGGGAERIHIRPVTDEDRLAEESQRLASKLSRLEYSVLTKLSIERLRAAVHILITAPNNDAEAAALAGDRP